jgi:beta-glucanase (GH16 family)
VANENYQHQPTPSTAYTRLDGAGWHELSLTFVCTERAEPDTGVYFALPSSGRLNWQVTGVRLTEIELPAAPALDRQAPDQVLSFNGAEGQPPDPSLWAPEVGGEGWGNDELQSYVDDRPSAQLDGQGHLVLTARREETTGPDGITRQFASARLTTRGRLTVPPGSYVEAEVTPPTGAGVWPAFWLLGQDIDTKGWPACGEIDIMEVLGSDPMTARSALHMADKSQPTRDRPYGGDSRVGATRFEAPLDTSAHRYGVYFDEHVVVFYIDHRKTFVYTAADAAASGRSWPFGQPMFLLLNVAVGGLESPEGTQFPRSMTVGPVQVWNGRAPT